jgi:hypothetical protein
MLRAAAFLVVFVLACRSSRAARGPVAGQLELNWRDSGRVVALVAPAEANWCAGDTLLELLAIQHDTGIGISLVARDSLRADSFPVIQGGVFIPKRPYAAGALRTLGATDLKSYTSIWGLVTVTDSRGKRVSGGFDMHVTLSGGHDTLHLTGGFDRVPVATAGLPCGRSNKPRTPHTP